MLSNAQNFKQIYSATGYSDLHRGIEEPTGIIRFWFHLDPYNENTIFFYCGKHCEIIKALIREEDEFLLYYKRIDNGSFNWPRCTNELGS